jgi:hypothetical protein
VFTAIPRPFPLRARTRPCGARRGPGDRARASTPRSRSRTNRPCRAVEAREEPVTGGVDLLPAKTVARSQAPREPGWSEQPVERASRAQVISAVRELLQEGVFHETSVEQVAVRDTPRPAVRRRSARPRRPRVRRAPDARPPRASREARRTQGAADPRAPHQLRDLPRVATPRRFEPASDDLDAAGPRGTTALSGPERAHSSLGGGAARLMRSRPRRRGSRSCARRRSGEAARAPPLRCRRR